MSAKRHEFSSYYKVLYIFYPYLEILKRVLFEFWALLSSILKATTRLQALLLWLIVKNAFEHFYRHSLPLKEGKATICF